MKKIISMIIVATLILSLGTGLKAEDKELNLMANLGFSFSDVEGLFIDLGIEKQIKENLFALLYLDYYFNPTGENYSGYGVDASLTLMGINAGAAYKREISDPSRAPAGVGSAWQTDSSDLTSPIDRARPDSSFSSFSPFTDFAL